MAKRIPYYDELLAAFGQSACPVCRVLDFEADRLVDAILFESVNDLRVREELNEARGFCGRHAALLVRPGGALGSATMMQGVIKHLLRTMDGAATGTGSSSRLRGLLGGGGRDGLADALAPLRPCPVCANETKLLEHYTTTLVGHLVPGGPLAAAYERSDGLCLDHFRGAVAAARGVKLETLVACQRGVWQRLNGELDEFLRKSDYRFSHEPMGAERDSWQRAIAAVSGPLPAHLTKE